MSSRIHLVRRLWQGWKRIGRKIGDVQVRGVGRAEVEVGPTSRREIVEDADPMAIGEETSGDVGADEPGAAGDQEQRRHLSIVTEQRGPSSKLGAVLLP